jgi:hypothetical protein
METGVTASVVADETRDKAASARRRELHAFAELFALCGIAFAQPALDILSKNAGLFVTRGTTLLQAIVLVALIVIGPPAALWALEALVASIAPWARRWLHGFVAAGLGGVIAVEVLKKETSFSPATLLWTGAAIGLAAGALVVFVALVRQFLRYLAFAPVAFALLFLVASPVTDVILKSDPGAAASAVGIGNPRRVLFVVFDELPLASLLDGKGRVDRELYPHFAALANDSTWYRNHTTVAPYTDAAVPAILTGRYPKSPEALPDISEYPRNLFTMLGKAYGMNVHEVITKLCPGAECGGSGEGFGGLIEQSARLWSQFASPRRHVFSFAEFEAALEALKEADEFVGSIERGDTPQLDFLHLELPHNPWHLIGTLQDYEEVGELRGARYLSWSNPSSAETAHQRHLLQLQAADTVLGRIVARLREVAHYEDTLVVVTADHGVSFDTRQPLRAVTGANYPDIMWTPLFVKYPGTPRARVDDRPAATIDIVPTIADVLDVSTDWEFDGRSLLAEPRPEGMRRLYQWEQHAIQPPEAEKPPPGRLYLEYDGAQGFTEVIGAQAAPPGRRPDLRIFQRGAFGNLVGQPAAPLVREDPANAEMVAAITDDFRFQDVAVKRNKIPWLYNEGNFAHIGDARPIAVGLNGTIAAVTRTVALNDTGDAFFTFLVPPPLVRAGSNEVTMYVIGGTPERPTLDPVRLGRGSRGA